MSSLFDNTILQAPIRVPIRPRFILLTVAQAFGTAFLFRRVFGQVDL